MTPVPAMADAGITLCVHGEVTDPEIDIFDREAVFIERVLILCGGVCRTSSWNMDNIRRD